MFLFTHHACSLSSAEYSSFHGNKYLVFLFKHYVLRRVLVDKANVCLTRLEECPVDVNLVFLVEPVNCVSTGT